MDTEDIEEVVEMVWKPWALPLATGLAGTAVGVGIGYIWHRRKLKLLVHVVEEYDDRVRQINREHAELTQERNEKDREFSEQIGEAHELLRAMNEKNRALINALKQLNSKGVIGGEVLVKEPTEGLEELPQLEETSVRTPPEERRDGDRRLSKAVSVNSQNHLYEKVVNDDPGLTGRNVFTDHYPGWNYEAELSTRDPEHPYIIHVDEYVNDEMGYDNQQTVTYYEADDILADQKDVPVYNYHQIFGELKFGHGSGDPNVVYIRNEKMTVEYEVLRDPGSFTEKISGEAIEQDWENADLKHFNEPRRMRRE